MATKEKIRPLYYEIQGYLSNAPVALRSGEGLNDSNLWEHYNQTIDELNIITEDKYDRFKVQPNQGALGPFVFLDTFRMKIGGIISRLHGTYFSDEPAPFSGMPNTTISVNQQQSQSIQIEIIMEMTELIHEKLNRVDKGSKEETFLKKVKDSLRGVTSITQLVALLVKTANELGLNIQELMKIFM